MKVERQIQSPQNVEEIAYRNTIRSKLLLIADLLLVNSSFTHEIGLLRGKCGISIFLFKYARYSQKGIYKEQAESLIDEIYEDILEITPIDFSNGLTGVGWGIEYLVNNRYVEADTDEILEDIDLSILRYRLNSPILLTKNDLFFGCGLYQIARMNNVAPNFGAANLIELNKQEHLLYLIDECERIIKDKSYKEELGIENLSNATINSLFSFLLDAMSKKIMIEKVMELMSELSLMYRPENSDSLVDNYTFNSLTLRLDSFFQRKIDSVIEDVEDKTLKEEHLLREFTKMQCDSFIYRIDLSINNQQLIKESLDYIISDKGTDEIYSYAKLSKFGLNNGLAGIGLGLLEYLLMKED